MTVYPCIRVYEISKSTANPRPRTNSSSVRRKFLFLFPTALGKHTVDRAAKRNLSAASRHGRLRNGQSSHFSTTAYPGHPTGLFVNPLTKKKGSMRKRDKTKNKKKNKGKERNKERWNPISDNPRRQIDTIVSNKFRSLPITSRFDIAIDRTTNDISKSRERNNIEDIIRINVLSIRLGLFIDRYRYFDICRIITKWSIMF